MSIGLGLRVETEKGNLGGVRGGREAEKKRGTRNVECGVWSAECGMKKKPEIGNRNEEVLT